MLNKMTRTAWLYDFYGKLLTEKQQKIVELYYHHDLSLKEIAEITQVSRQAVHDLLKRAHSSMEEYEEKLGCLEQYLKEKNILEELNKLISEIEIEEEKQKQILSLLAKLLKDS